MPNNWHQISNPSRSAPLNVSTLGFRYPHSHRASPRTDPWIGAALARSVHAELLTPMSRSFFPTCSSQKAEIEEMGKELDDLRAKVEALTAQLRANSDLADGLKRAGADQAAWLRDARAEAERNAVEAAASSEEAAATGDRCGVLESRLAKNGQALRHLYAAHEALNGTLREKIEGLEGDKRGLLTALEDAEGRRVEHEAALRACDNEIARLRGLLSEKDWRGSEAEKRVLTPREVVMRDDMLVKPEEEKATVEGKLNWKAEQFRHLEEALNKLHDGFRAVKKEWGLDRSTFVDRIGTLEDDLDSKTRVTEDFPSRLDMCSQALAHEEGCRKRVEAELSELRLMYGYVVSEYEGAKSMMESLSSKTDGGIAYLRRALAEKVTLLKEIGYSKAHLEQENEDLRSSLKEYQEAQIGGTYAVVSLKSLWEKFRALEQTHRSCTKKLRDKEEEWRIQTTKLVNDLVECISDLESKDILIGQLQNELFGSYRSLELQTVESWEALIFLTVVLGKFHESCSFVDTAKLNMQHHCQEIEKEIGSAKRQLEEQSCIIVQSQAEQKQQYKVIAKLHARIEELEHMEQKQKKMQMQLDAYKEMLDNTSRDANRRKVEASKKENTLQEKLREALTESYMYDNRILKRDLDAALVANVKAEELLRQEKVKLICALDEAKFTLSERNNELTEFKINLEKVKVDMETELKICIDENCVLKRDLDVVLIAKMEADECHTKEKQELCGIINDKGMMIDKLQQRIVVLEEENMVQKLDLGSLIKMEYEKSIHEVKNRYYEIVEVSDKKLLELEERIRFFEQKFACREQELMQMFNQEKADRYTLIAEKEIAISDIQQTVESVQVDIEHLLEAAATKVAEVELEVNQLYGFAETLNSLNVIQGHDTVFKDMLIAECERELDSLQVSLLQEKHQSRNLKNLMEQLKARTASEMSEKAKQHLEVTNKLKLLEERNETLEEHVRELKSRTADMSIVVIQERNQLVNELTGLTDTIGEVIYGGESMMSNLRRISQKINEEEQCNDRLTSEKTNGRSSAPLIRSKPRHVPVRRRSPLKEQNY
ncbi:Uncharacterized protein Zm00014a_040688 [Zea mays]|uniref:Basic helix-loop-helix (BHLH) DNA-binding superfamily protein n=1 Tax=Zea mays TaxID=4577 RepID=A0A3L6EKN8_MAIZE|nr:Uncharacterized protein Zm00014a_040688 [Zea mays]